MTVFTITYNEELMLPYFIKHYRNRFPNCKIVVYDNESTDNTVKIALDNNCKVITYCTNNKLSDKKYLDIKNNCWKNETGWVIVADCDEFVHVNERDLQKEKSTVLKFEAYNMVNFNNDFNLENITNGVRSESYDKSYCFNTKEIKEINYGMGCHWANPVGNVVYSEIKYICCHYKYFNLNYMIERHGMFAKRLSDENINRGYGGHYLYTPKQIRKEYLQAVNNSKKIL